MAMVALMHFVADFSRFVDENGFARALTSVNTASPSYAVAYVKVHETTQRKSQVQGSGSEVAVAVFKLEL